MREPKKVAMEPSSNSSSSSRDETTTPSTCRLFELPQPLIMDILSRLLIKDLIHCRCVCKRLLCFISDPEFAWLHLERSPIGILIKTRPPKNNSKRLQLAQVEADGPGFKVSKLNFTTKFHVPIWDFIYMSSCNGLICLIGEKDDEPFYVCNPTLGEFITIKPPYGYENRGRGGYWGLGYSTVTNQYKLLQSFYPSVGSEMVEIYTVGTGTWRSLGNAPSDMAGLPFNAFLNGAVHWYNNGCSGAFINYFDFDVEEFGTFPPPDCFVLDNKAPEYASSPQFTRIGVLGGCLYIIHFNSSYDFDIFVMEEYGVKESWTKKFVVEGIYPEEGYGWDAYQPIVVLSNGEMLIYFNDEVISSYNLERKELKETKFFRTRSVFDAVAYTPCFVSLHNVAKGEEIFSMQSTNVYNKLCKEEFLWL